MFGIKDPTVALVYLLCICSAALCVVYGLITWNKGEEPVAAEDVKWAAEEKKVEEKL